jgi:[protein-PII] uridylyltransferase
MSSHESAAVLTTPPPALTLAPDADWGQQVRVYLEAATAELAEEHQRGASGHEIVRRYTATMDHLILALFEAASAAYAERYSRLDQRCAVVAQGGYGRAELNPHSDIDLLFLYQHKREPYIEYIAERMLYSLWGPRLIVGHAMRNVRECARLAAKDFKVKTSLLDARFLCGDEALYREFATAMERDVLMRGAAKFFKEKLAENRERHERFGDSVYLLEPQLKEGEGGLRDLHTAMWMAKVKFKTNGIAELVHKGVITERELEELEAARDFLFRVRNALHFLSGQHQDQLTFEYQERIAADLGFRDLPTMKGV